SAPLVRIVCRLLTTSPLDPSLRVGIGPPSGSAFQVSGPTTPSTVSPALSWNSLTAVSVWGSKVPLIVMPRFGVRRNARCRRRTLLPLVPGMIVGSLGFDRLRAIYSTDRHCEDKSLMLRGPGGTVGRALARER